MKKCIQCEEKAVCRDLCQWHYNRLPEVQEKKNSSNRRRYQENPEIRQKSNVCSKAWREKNRERNCQRLREWREENKEKRLKYQNDYTKRRKEADPSIKLAANLRSRLAQAVKRGGATRERGLYKLLGCSREEFKAYLESLFTEGMTWENYGRKGWHIDHKKPISCFDLNDQEQLKEACHYTNLQPMWAIENIKKGGRNRLPITIDQEKL